MKKNKLLVAVVTTKIYEYNTDAETSDVAMDSFLNQSGRRFKLVEKKVVTEIESFEKLKENKNGKNL